MSENQFDDYAEVISWIRAVLRTSGTLRVRPSLQDQIEDAHIGWQDVLYVLKCCEDVRHDFAPNCYTIRGQTLDDDSIRIAVVITGKNSDVIRILKIWREGKK